MLPKDNRANGREGRQLLRLLERYAKLSWVEQIIVLLDGSTVEKAGMIICFRNRLIHCRTLVRVRPSPDSSDAKCRVVANAAPPQVGDDLSTIYSRSTRACLQIGSGVNSAAGAEESSQEQHCLG